MVTLEPLSPNLLAEFIAVRLRALEDTPSAFGSTYARESQLSHSEWLARIDLWNNATTSFCRIAIEISNDGKREPCGIAAGYLEKNDPTIPNLASMWVAPTHRRSGLGTRLVAEVERWAQTIGAAELRLMVTSNNAAAISFYQRCGFVLTGRTEPYPNDPALFEYEMIKSLRALHTKAPEQSSLRSSDR